MPGGAERRGEPPVEPPVEPLAEPPAEPPAEPLAELRDLDDRELIRRHCAGEPDAFGEIFRRHRDRMWAVALRTTGQRELASDCVQEAFISAYRRAGSYRGEAAVTTWLHRIVVNACLDRLRRDKPTSTLPEYDLPDRFDAYGAVETRMDVQQALATLPEAQRLALVLVDMHGVSVAEAAVILSVAEGTIKSRCSRGRATLAEVLRPKGPGPSTTPTQATAPEGTPAAPDTS